MAKHSKKSTKKFEKNHLKDTIERRKEFAKIKQRQQIKAKKQARHASDYAKVSDEDEEEKQSPKDNGRKAKDADKLKDMTVDEFFQGGFEIPEPTKKASKLAKIKEAKAIGGKRKRETLQAEEDSDLGGEESDVSVQEQPLDVDSLSEEEAEERPGAHREDLDALQEKDPDFYKYLKENDAELLDFAEDGDLAEVDDLSEDEPPKKKKKGKTIERLEEENDDDDDTEVTMSMVGKWQRAMTEQHSLRAMRQVVLAFRAAAYVNEEDGKEYKYTISGPEVYHQLLVVSLKHVPEVLGHHLPTKETASGKVRFSTDTKKFRSLTPLLKSHATSVHHLLENLSDAPTIKLTLASILPLLPYLLSFKKILKNLVKAVIGIWSDPSSTEATRINAFLLIRRLAVISDPSLREAVLKSTYQGLIKGSRNTTIHTLSGINLMKNSAAELWGLDPTIGYTTGFTYIRQLAIHLRSSITHPTKDSYKAIYNWQYTHSLDFWSRVLCTHCSPATNPHLKSATASPLHPLIYPLVQITLGALRLIPTPVYFPLRFHLTRALLRLSRSTTTYIPLAPSLLEVLQSPELKKPPKPSTLRPLDFATTLRAPTPYLHTRVYQTALGEQVAELLAEFFAVWARSIAFPELVIPPSVLLKRWLKEVSSAPTPAAKHSNSNNSSQAKGRGNKNSKLTAAVALLLQKLDANAKFVEARRRTVDFAPGNRDAVEGFLTDVAWEDMPLGAFVVGMRTRNEERERVLEEGRRREEEERRRGRKGEGVDAGDGVAEVGEGVEEEEDVEMEDMEGAEDEEDDDDDE
ncbi:Nucleolar Complex 2 protein [Xylographa trunciseda]|nr:Nucleolar Complex 2 protein [Xylographa trunciseda]